MKKHKIMLLLFLGISVFFAQVFLISCGKKQDTGTTENKDTINLNRMTPIIKDKAEQQNTEQQNTEENNQLKLADSLSSLNSSPINLKWEFKNLGEGEYGEPINMVYLLVNNKRNEIAKIEFSFSETNKSSYKDNNIPQDALTSCRGWWAGAGIDYWIIRRGGELIVMSKEIGETSDENGEPTDYEDKPIKLKTIKIE